MTGKKEEVGVHADAPTGPVVEGVPPPSPGGMLKPSEVLDRAAALIEPEGKWTQGAYWRDKQGWQQLGRPPTRAASCMCLVGALARASRQTPYQVEKAPWLSYLRPTMGKLGPVAWNDSYERTQAEVVAALRAAAELARSEGQ